MSTRTQRVEEMLRRAIAEVVLFGKLRDPRLQGVSIGITAVRVTPDLAIARVFVDPMIPGAGDGDFDRVLRGLRAAAPAIRREIGHRIRLKRTPELQFMRDESIEKGLAIERVLAELRDERGASAADPEASDGSDGAKDTGAGADPVHGGP